MARHVVSGRHACDGPRRWQLIAPEWIPPAQRSTGLPGGGRRFRVAGIVDGLRAFGARIETDGDDIVIDGPTELRGAVVDSLGDHRLAMTFAIAGLVADGQTSISDAASVAISYPTFFADLERIRS